MNETGDETKNKPQNGWNEMVSIEMTTRSKSRLSKQNTEPAECASKSHPASTSKRIREEDIVFGIDRSKKLKISPSLYSSKINNMPNSCLVIATEPEVKTQNEMTAGSDGTVVKMEFCIGEIVWCKIRGYVHWPARIVSVVGNRSIQYNVY